MKYITIIIISFFICSCSSSRPHANTDITLKVSVAEYESKKIIPKATVKLYRIKYPSVFNRYQEVFLKEVKTDSLGECQFQINNRLNYSITAKKLKSDIPGIGFVHKKDMKANTSENISMTIYINKPVEVMEIFDGIDK